MWGGGGAQGPGGVGREVSVPDGMDRRPRPWVRSRHWRVFVSVRAMSAPHALFECSCPMRSGPRSAGPCLRAALTPVRLCVAQPVVTCTLAPPLHADLRPALLSSPAVLLRPEMRGVARVGELIAGLTRARVDSARTLAAAWKAKPTLLQAELAAWLGKSQQRALLQMWPLLLQQAGSVAAAAAVAGTGMAPAPMHESGGVGRGRDRGQARA